MFGMQFEHLDIYYEDCVIGGPGSFVVGIKERAQFKDATRTKLVLEIAGHTPEPKAKPAQARVPRVYCSLIETIVAKHVDGGFTFIQTSLEIAEPLPPDVPVGADITVKVRVSCTSGCNLRNVPLKVVAPDGAAIASRFTIDDTDDCGRVRMKAAAAPATIHGPLYCRRKK